jgi:Domain of unknown function (DUF4760)
VTDIRDSVNATGSKMLTIQPKTPLKTREPDGLLRISLTLTIGIGVTSFISAAILIALHWFQPKYRETLNFAVTALATAAGISTAVYALRELEINLEDKKIDRTLRYIQIWNDPSFSNYCKLAAEVHNNLQSLETVEKNQYINDLYQDITRKQEIANLLNFLEEMSSCIHSGLIDENLLKNFYRYIVLTYCQTFQLFIETSRSDKNNPNLYKGLTDLCEHWRSTSKSQT